MFRRVLERGEDGREDECGGDEGDVDGKEGNPAGQVAGRHQTGVGALAEGDAGIVAQGLGNLAIARVDSEDACGAVLEHAVGESTGGSADVEAEAAGKVDGPLGESGFELEAASADVAEVAAEKADGGVLGDGVAGLVDLLLSDEHAAGEDEGLSAFAGGSKASLHQQFVETNFHDGSA